MFDLKWGRPRRVPPRAYALMLDAWGFSIGLASIFAAVIAVVVPESATNDVVTAKLGEVFQGIYTLGYGISGSFIVWGLASRNYPADALGLCLLSAMLLVRVVLIFAVVGWEGVYYAPTLAALAIAALARAAVVSRVVEPNDRPSDAP